MRTPTEDDAHRAAKAAHQAEPAMMIVQTDQTDRKATQTEARRVWKERDEPGRLLTERAFRLEHQRGGIEINGGAVRQQHGGRCRPDI